MNSRASHNSTHFLRHVWRQQRPRRVIHQAVGEILQMHPIQVPRPARSAPASTCALRTICAHATFTVSGIVAEPRRVHDIQLAEPQPQRIQRQRQFAGIRVEIDPGRVDRIPRSRQAEHQRHVHAANRRKATRPAAESCNVPAPKQSAKSPAPPAPAAHRSAAPCFAPPASAAALRIAPRQRRPPAMRVNHRRRRRHPCRRRRRLKPVTFVFRWREIIHPISFHAYVLCHPELRRATNCESSRSSMPIPPARAWTWPTTNGQSHDASTDPPSLRSARTTHPSPPRRRTSPPPSARSARRQPQLEHARIRIRQPVVLDQVLAHDVAGSTAVPLPGVPV